MNAMKRGIVLFLLAALTLSSCGPYSYTLTMEMRQPSKSGLDLDRKSFAVACLNDGDAADSAFIMSVSEGFARSLEEEYFAGEPVIGIYTIGKTPGADYSSRDSVMNVLLDTGSDVVFIFDSPDLEKATLSAPQAVAKPVVRDSAYLVEASVPFSLRLYVYDSMNPDDKVLVYTGKSVAKPVAYTDGFQPDSVALARAMASLSAPGLETGEISGGPFLPQWQAESFSFTYYDSEPWIEAVIAAHEYRWSDAIGQWIKLSDTGNMQRRSCAAYNLALTFHILDQQQIAKEWLDVSDSTYPLHLSYDLRKKIEAKLKK